MIKQKIFTDFAPRHAEVWGRHTLKLGHSLAGLDIFSDASLATLIETVPASHLAITTMSATGHDNRNWKYCDRAGLSGADVLEAVKKGRLWINMTSIHEVDPYFATLLERMYEEMAVLVPGFDSFKQRLGLLISSPDAQVYYHCDVPGQGLWQLRGKKRIWVYPNAEPFLRTEELERVVRGAQEEEITYQPWYDDHAVAYDLEPGTMLHWPLNGPHRVKNYDMVNVSITTEHWTPELRRHFAMNYGNGMLRRMGWRPRSRAISGPSFWPKAAMALAWSKSGMQKKTGFKRKMEFRVDPKAPNGIAPLDQGAAAAPAPRPANDGKAAKLRPAA
jgi:hypothetical protein